MAKGRGLAFTWHLLPASVPMQAQDNYSDFVEELSAGVIVVLATQRERMREKKKDNYFSISQLQSCLTPPRVHVQV